jgi:hypothetical protein
MEMQYEVKAVGIRYACDVGGCTGEMNVVANGADIFVMDSPTLLIRHVCTVCGTKMELPDKYPTIRHYRV